MPMMGIKVDDRVFLGLIAGFAGNIAKTAVDEYSLRKGLSQRSFRSTSAGVWVNKKSEADSLKGQILGSFLDFGMAGLGGLAIVELLTRTGNDRILAKGVLSGVTIGSMITALLSIFPSNKVRPKNAASNLSYMVSHAVYGLVATYVAATVGSPTLFDAEPRNDYLQPTSKTSGQRMTKAAPQRTNIEGRAPTT